VEGMRQFVEIKVTGSGHKRNDADANDSVNPARPEMCYSPRRGMLVDIFLLRVVDAHQGLDRLDDALCVSNEVPVGVFNL
jgi:hypothetical protein